MTTHTSNAAYSNDSDAEFRVWGQQYSAALAAIGLVKTTDTGQVDWATAVRLGPSLYHYEIWRMNDDLQPESPIFIRVEYGSGNALSNVTIRVGFGTETDGAGTLGGATTGIAQAGMGISYNPLSTTAQYPTYACAVNGAAWINHKPGSIGATQYPGPGTWGVFRTCDIAGNPTNRGYVAGIAGQSTDGTFAAVRTEDPWRLMTTAVTSSAHIDAMGFRESIEGTPPVFMVVCPMPEITPFLGLIGGATGAIGQLDEVQVAMHGTTQRNYLSMSPFLGPSNYLPNLGIWE